MVLLNELNADEAKSVNKAALVAEKTHAALAEPYLIQVRRTGKAGATFEHHCTSSIGVVLFIDHDRSADEIMKCADKAVSIQRSRAQPGSIL